jgi:hypothetical protein
MSINEVREMENLNPLGPEGDKHFIQLNMTTLDRAGEEPPAPEPVAEPPVVVEAEDSPADELEDDAETEEQTDGD